MEQNVILATPAQQDQSYQLGDLLINYLEQLDIDYLFGIPGGAIEPLYNALARSERRGGLRAITARHETGAAFMAEGYTRATGKIGVCCSTTGPGATNLITGVSSAYENQIPMLVITAQTPLAHFGKGALQESSCTALSTVGMFQYCTRYNSLISHPDQFEQKLITAIMTAFQFPQGPVHLSIPTDVMRGLTPIEKPSFYLPKLIQSATLVDENEVKTLCQTIQAAKQVVFVLGLDSGETVGIILEIAIQIKATVVTTPDGKGFISPLHPLYRGVVGVAGHPSANNALSDPKTDLVIVVGTRLSEWATGAWNPKTILTERLVHIEADKRRFTRSLMAKLHINGNLHTIFNKLQTLLYDSDAQQIAQDTKERWRNDLSEMIKNRKKPKFYLEIKEQEKFYGESNPIKPQQLMRCLAELLPPSACYVADNGNSMMWAIHYLLPYDLRLAGQHNKSCGSLSVSMEFASMGWAIGTSIGVALARKNQPIVCITGDGSHLMSGQEITVAVQEQLTLIYIILNDKAYGMVKHGQRLGNAEPIAFQLPDIDYSLYAQAIGARCYRIDSPADLQAIDFSKICKQKAGPTLLDVRIDPEEIPPMHDRVRVINVTSKQK